MDDTTVAPCGYTKAEIMDILGIKPPRSRMVDLPQEVVELLGKRTDRELALRAGVSVITIARNRARRGIMPYMPRSRTGKEESQAKMDTVRAMLGQVPDTVIADYCRVHKNTVRNWRDRLGIPLAYVGPKKFTPEIQQLLGTMPDTVLAKRAGSTASHICTMRKRFGIPKYSKKSEG